MSSRKRDLSPSLILEIGPGLTDGLDVPDIEITLSSWVRTGVGETGSLYEQSKLFHSEELF